MTVPARAGDELPVSPAPASRVRWQLLGLMFLLSMVTYLDRINISIAAKPMMAAYHLTDVEMGKIFSAFILAYGLFQVPGGWLGDRFGPRLVLTGAIAWWSLFTALTAATVALVPVSVIPAVWSLIIVRFCFGAGEAAAWPCFNRTIANWMSPEERGFATSMPLAGGGLGAAITPPFIAWVMVKYGWEESFYIAALIGLVAAAVWFWQVRDTPEAHPRVNDAELRVIRASSGAAPGQRREVGSRGVRTPWRAILTDRTPWLLFASAATCGYLVYIYMTWFYTFLLEERHLTPLSGSLYTIGPFLAMAILSPLGGVLSDAAARRFGIRFGRRIVSMGGMLVSGASLVLGLVVSDIRVAILGLSLGAGAIYFALSAHWATTIDVSREHAGTVSGVMNWGGNMGGMVSPILTPILVRRWGWTPALGIAAVLIWCGALLWLFINAERPLRVTDNAHAVAKTL